MIFGFRSAEARAKRGDTRSSEGQPSDDGSSEFDQPHGGSLAAAMAAFPDAAKPWVDLSTGINPYPWPWPDSLPSLDPGTLTALPEPDALARLEAVAAETYRASDARMVAAAPGTQILISMLPRLFPASRVGILGPTYSEHRIAWESAGATVDQLTSPDHVNRQDVVVAVNPNNPDGKRFDPGRLVALARDRLVIVDEAFADLEELALSVVPKIRSQRLIVLRSFGKTYGLAGLRLGFAIAPVAMIDSFRDAFGPWPVSGAAQQIGKKALADLAWRGRMAAKLQTEAEKLDDLLSRHRFEIIGGTALFRLARIENAQAMFDRLCRNGILVRKFEDRPGHIRFGIPKPDGFAQLEAALVSDR